MSIELALKLQRIGRPRCLVIGDQICDQEIYCTAERFSQEANHCPVWKHERTFERRGGAAAVDAMAFGLGAASSLLTSWESIKQRYFVNGVQIVRVDHGPIDSSDSALLARQVATEVKRSDVVLIANYGKGVCTEEVLRSAIGGAKEKGIPVILDPHDMNEGEIIGTARMGPYHLKCNKKQWSRLGRPVDSKNNIFVTEPGGISLFGGDGVEGSGFYEARKRSVVDVVGAGDMVLACLGVCISGGLSWEDACEIANAAAGLKVERRGAVPVSRHEVVVDLLDGIKVIPSELLQSIGKFADVVMTNGCFDTIHRGHLHLLTEAKAQGKRLVVALNDDEDVKRLKGHKRPIHSQDERAAVLSYLEMVDHVVIFSGEEELEGICEVLKPAVLVKGDEYRGEPVTGAEHAGRVHFVEQLPGYSTTRTIERMRV